MRQKLILKLFGPVFLLYLLSIATGVIGQDSQLSFDPHLADSLGADEYGMKSYYFVLLVTGEGTEPNPEKRAALFRGHLDNISRLSDEGKLVLAGPFGKNDLKYRGLFIINSKSIEEAEEMLMSDPAIAADLLRAQIVPWYGSAALPVYIETHRKISKSTP